MSKKANGRSQSSRAGMTGEGLKVWGPPESIWDLWSTLLPAYESKNYGPLGFSIIWDPEKAQEIREISEKRAKNRIDNYVIIDELERVEKKLTKKGEASIRFGNSKPGHGYSGERGDFCLVGGVVKPKHLTLYYRSLELIGGLAYDLTLVRYLEEALGCSFRQVDFLSAKVFSFALKGNSNEKLYPKLKEIYRG